MGAVPTPKGRKIASIRRWATPVSSSLGGERGFTLIEILVTMGIAAIITALALPGFLVSVRNDRLTTQANSLVVSLNYARTEAIKRDSPVFVCADNGTAACVPTAAWNLGWMVVPTALQVLTYPALQSVPPMSSCNYVTAGATGNLAASQIAFGGDGRVASTSLVTAGQPAVFFFCDKRGATSARSLRVDILGRVELFPQAGYQYGTAANPIIAIPAAACPTSC